MVLSKSRTLIAKLCCGVLLGVPLSVEAGTNVTVYFSCPEISGSFHYDQGKAASPVHSGVFTYAPADIHGITTTLASNLLKDQAEKAACPTFQLTTMSDPTGKMTFKLHAAYTNTASPPAPVVIDIALTTATTLSGDTLPVCSAFPDTASPTGHIVKTVGGSQVANCDITVAACTPAAFGFIPPGITAPAVAWHATPAAPMYACPPRRGCFLTGLFHRRSIGTRGR